MSIAERNKARAEKIVEIIGNDVAKEIVLARTQRAAHLAEGILGVGLVVLGGALSIPFGLGIFIGFSIFAVLLVLTMETGKSGFTDSVADAYDRSL